MATKREVTSRPAASAASKVLRSSDASKSAKAAAGSALSQRNAPPKVTSASAATAASKALRNPDSSKFAKTSAGSALTQRTTKKR